MQEVRMTAAEFYKTHSDFKATFDGKPFVLMQCGGKGTCFVPVVIVKK